MELGRDPGLGVRILHEQGITGKGVGIAIIDQTLLTDHQEYKDRLRFYEEYNTAAQQAAQMHGAAVASIALGETAGVAPDALLYYIADDTGTYKDETYTQDMRFYARDIDRFVALNETLAADEKIRVISISLGYMPDTPGAQEMDAAIARARAAGIAVVYVSDSDRMMKNYMGAGRAPYGDPNDPAQRLPGRFWQPALFGGEYTTSRALLVPMDRRTAASPSGTDEYAYYVNGGMSWAIPYIAGLYALACQVDPDVTFEQFTGAAIETAQPLSLLHEGRQYSYGRLVNPAALLGKINGKPVPCWSGACPAT
nr:S8 family serine peptidase [Anaerotruncus colihominis]